ncbi:MAG: toll/interleukin-1 receptor domain-containing protein [Acidimicrobiales bacterium]
MASRDVFICHASADKKTVVEPLASALSRRSVSCWVDQAEIKAGESIIDAIEDGIRLSTFVVVIVTEPFLDRPWPRKEMNAAFAREVRLNSTVIIPVLDVSQERWEESAPLQADKKCLAWSDGVEAVADGIAKRFDRTPAIDWAHNHPERWVGLVWLRVNAPDMADGDSLDLTLRWGPYLRRLTYTRTNDGPRSFVHHKTNADSVTLHVHCSHPAIVTFGTGAAPDPVPNAENIDEWWTRAAGIEVNTPSVPANLPLPGGRRELAEILDEELPDPRFEQADRLLLADFCRRLPSTSRPITTLRDHDLAVPFRMEWFTPLYDFLGVWDNAEHQFHDGPIEAACQLFLSQASEFCHRLSVESGSEPGGWQAVVPVDHRDTFRMGGHEEDVRRVDELNKLAADLFDQHQRLISSARRRLAV